MMSVDNDTEAKKYLEKGLESVEAGDIDNAAESFFHAAVEFEKVQDFRSIPALWEAIGKLFELYGDPIPHVTEKWPLDYHIMETDEWHENDMMHKLAWVYQWAAEHRERVADPHMAYPLFFKSAKKAEQTKDIRSNPNWPAKCYQKAVLNFIRTYGTIEDAPEDAQRIKKGVLDKELINKGIKRMEELYLEIEGKSKAYRLLAISYRLFKSNLIETGNLSEAKQFERKERSALMHHYFHSESYFRTITEWLSGSGFMYFIIGLFLTILFVFPYIYYNWDLITSPQDKITYPDTIFYSIESALGVGHNEFNAVGVGKLLNIVEASLSWLGLGLFIWWLTRRLE